MLGGRPPACLSTLPSSQTYHLVALSLDSGLHSRPRLTGYTTEMLLNNQPLPPLCPLPCSWLPAPRRAGQHHRLLCHGPALTVRCGIDRWSRATRMLQARKGGRLGFAAMPTHTAHMCRSASCCTHNALSVGACQWLSTNTNHPPPPLSHRPTCCSALPCASRCASRGGRAIRLLLPTTPRPKPPPTPHLPPHPLRRCAAAPGAAQVAARQGGARQGAGDRGPTCQLPSTKPHLAAARAAHRVLWLPDYICELGGLRCPAWLGGKERRSSRSVSCRTQGPAAPWPCCSAGWIPFCGLVLGGSFHDSMIWGLQIAASCTLVTAGRTHARS